MFSGKIPAKGVCTHLYRYRTSVSGKSGGRAVPDELRCPARQSLLPPGTRSFWFSHPSLSTCEGATPAAPQHESPPKDAGQVGLPCRTFPKASASLEKCLRAKVSIGIATQRAIRCRFAAGSGEGGRLAAFGVVEGAIEQARFSCAGVLAKVEEAAGARSNRHATVLSRKPFPFAPAANSGSGSRTSP